MHDERGIGRSLNIGDAGLGKTQFHRVLRWLRMVEIAKACLCAVIALCICVAVILLAPGETYIILVR